MPPCISVIIPVYNADKYLRECLDSVCSQTLREIEIICINDGSTDKSPEILTEYEEKDNRIHIVNQSNAGAGAARNKGIEKAQGEYLAFIDADDFWKPRLLETAYRQVKSFDADLCIYPFAVFDNQTGSISSTYYAGWFPQKQSFHPIQYRNQLFQMLAPAPGYCLYRRKFILNHQLAFLPQHIAEDIYFVFLSAAFSEKICFIRDVYAFLRRGLTENLSSGLSKYPRETHYSLLKIRQQLEKAGVYTTYRKTFRIAAISSSEYIFWRIPTEILPINERLQMLKELDITDKPFIISYHPSNNNQNSGKLQTLFRMIRTYGINYSAHYCLQSIQKKDNI